MKTTLLQVMTWVRKLPHKFKKNEVCIYICTGLVVLFLSILFLQNVKHSKESLKQQKTILELENRMIEEFDFFMEIQQVLQKERNKSYQLQETIYDQNEFIRQIIIYLKKIKHWPPKLPPEPPADPNTLAESDAEPGSISTTELRAL